MCGFFSDPPKSVSELVTYYMSLQYNTAKKLNLNWPAIRRPAQLPAVAVSSRRIKCFSINFPTSAGSNCPFFVFIYYINGVNKHKKGQFEPAEVGKLFAKHFSMYPLHCQQNLFRPYMMGTYVIIIFEWILKTVTFYKVLFVCLKLKIEILKYLHMWNRWHFNVTF
jgi:hypothetical protein